MSKANVKKRPANAEAAAMTAKKRIKPASVKLYSDQAEQSKQWLKRNICGPQEVLVKVKALAKKVRDDPGLTRYA